ncbi:MAG: DUF4003 domain-containing protein [Lachnospiraceae bacterium]|nr:DUF4003 domain-containing protein [Lachnospiraceae bacterium]
MKDAIKTKVDLLVANREKIEKEFKWGYSLMNIAAALVFSAAGKEADIERVKACKEILKKNTGAFSVFRDTSEAIVVSKMALADDPERYLKEVKAVYDRLNKGELFDSSFMLQGAISIYEAGRADDTELVKKKAEELYKKMAKKHPILTSSEDIIFVIMLAMTDKSADSICEEIEECYSYLKDEIRIKVEKNELQGLGEILALTDGNIREKSDRVVRLYNTIKEHGVKWGNAYNEFAALGTLIDADSDNDALVDEIVEVSDYLKSIKGFGNWSIDSKQRLLFSAMLVGDSYSMNGALMNSSALNSTVAMVIAEEVAIMMCIMICVTSSSSSN